LEVNDLAVAKLAAGRDKDTDFVTELFRHKLAEAELTLSRLRQSPLADKRLELALARLKRLAAV